VSRRCPSCGTSFSDEVFFCGNDGTITVQEQDPSDTDPRLGKRLGGYIVVARVADGAMGRVYEGRHPETRARVAIKVLHADVARDHVAVERFKREYETAAELSHPNVVKVLELGETHDGSWFLTMEYLEGEELGELVRREGAIRPERVLRILTQAALALDFAHSFGVIHRDLKPDNIFLCKSAEGDAVRLLDFGSVKLQMEMGPKLTAFGTTLGSPYYMSPEQAMGKQDVDQRTDVFALAAILFEMVTGKIAFEGASIAEILMKIVNESSPVLSQFKPGQPPALDGVVDKGLRKDKTERFATSGELALAACAAYGIGASVEAVAAMPIEAIAEKLRAAPAPALPPPPQPGGRADMVAPPMPLYGAPPPTHPQAVPHAPSNPPFDLRPSAYGPPPRSGAPILVLGLGVAVVLLAVIAGTLAAIFLF
jgi:serine/threonine-protein kinase